MSLNCYPNALSSSSKIDIKKKFAKTFDLSQVTEDPMDIYLESLGLWKKRIARDGSCLFRAVSEQIYSCQLYHIKVRNDCVKFMSLNRNDYEKFVNKIDDYLEQLKNPLEYGGPLEIYAMSKLYKRDFIIYKHPNTPGIDVTQNGFDDKILLCYSYNNHFDAVFTKKFRDNLALIQSLVYEILYDKVFNSGEQVSVARKLLRKSDTIYPKEFMDIRNSYDESDYYEEDNDEDKNKFYSTDNSQISNINDKQKMPLPYKVAKSLDPIIYRNTAFDAWLAKKKENETAKHLELISKLQFNEICLIRIMSSHNNMNANNNNMNNNWVPAYFQNLNSDSTVDVISVEYNERHRLTLDNIKLNLLNNNHNNNNGNNEIINNNNHNNTYNIQKLVQPINEQLSAIFSNNEYKRKTLKKKQPMKKSSSCHAFSSVLPTVPEVNEDQNDDLIHHNYRYSHPNHAMHHHSHHYINNHQLQQTNNNIFQTDYNSNYIHYHPGYLAYNNNDKQLFSNTNYIAHFNTNNTTNNHNNYMPATFNNNNLNTNTTTVTPTTTSSITTTTSTATNNSNMINNNNNNKNNNVYINNNVTYGSNSNSSNNNNNNNIKNQNNKIRRQKNYLKPWNQTTNSIHLNSTTQTNSRSLTVTPTTYASSSSLYQNSTAFGQHTNYQQIGCSLQQVANYTNPPAYIMPQSCNSDFYYTNNIPNKQLTSQPYTEIQSQRKRHNSYDGFPNNKSSNQSNYQQVPQHIPITGQQSALTTKTGETPSNYLLMPASSLSLPPPPHQYATGPANTTTGGLQRSQSYPANISTAVSDNNQPVYIDLYIPPTNATPSMYTSASRQSLMYQSNQAIMINNATPASINANSASLYNNCLDNTINYDLQYPHIDNVNLGSINTNNGPICATDLPSQQQRTQQNIIWNKNTKFGKNNNLFPDDVNQNESFTYGNYFVVNIDGPINFTATHSLQDDGSDLPLNDMNTIRFFYNLGIEYYRLNIAANNSYSQQANYTTPCYNNSSNNTFNYINTINSTSHINMNNSIGTSAISANSSTPPPQPPAPAPVTTQTGTTSSGTIKSHNIISTDNNNNDFNEINKKQNNQEEFDNNNNNNNNTSGNNNSNLFYNNTNNIAQQVVPNIQNTNNTNNTQKIATISQPTHINQSRKVH